MELKLSKKYIKIIAKYCFEKNIFHTLRFNQHHYEKHKGYSINIRLKVTDDIYWSYDIGFSFNSAYGDKRKVINFLNKVKKWNKQKIKG